MVPCGDPHVVLLAFPFGSHAAALFTVARALAAAAPSATFSFLSTARSIASLPTAQPLANIRFYAVGDGLLEGGEAPPTNIEEKIKMFMGAAPENLRVGVEAAVVGSGGAVVSCVVSDAFLWVAAEVAAKAGVPWIPVWTAAAMALYAHLHTDLLRREIGVGQEGMSIKINIDIFIYIGLNWIGSIW
ncbi:putative UDP-glycosyltransferase 78D2 [Cocos nucifera]|uniref:Putative UDP-glycosyltransferase 78D2 n=1 Tax=Cocos nucifera TaxID=13894 RepID=A0A8K0HUQ0_COCNU|nr:putative UDP-glycosyltransferase 78D2 [Cocos nucifera]